LLVDYKVIRRRIPHYISEEDYLGVGAMGDGPSYFNFFGTSYIPGVRKCPKTNQLVYYEFFVIFGVPLLWLNSLVAKEEGTYKNRINALWTESTTNYSTYGAVKDNLWEILFIYLRGWSIFAIIVAIIWILCEL
jgi:hypothetical protein